MPDAELTDHRRNRPQITATVHPDTVSRMHALCKHYTVSRGMLIDKLILAMHAQYTSGRVYCIGGEPCRFNRTDVAPIL